MEQSTTFNRPINEPNGQFSIANCEKLPESNSSLTIPICSTCIEYLPTFTTKQWPSHVGKYRIHRAEKGLIIHHEPLIGSMYAIYGNIYHQYTPNVSIYIYMHHTWILWDSSLTLIRKTFGRPKTFNEMFLFNAAVMGFGNSGWMHLVLEQHLGAAKQLGYPQGKPSKKM